MIIIMLGAPGTGKGTVGKLLSSELNIAHVSSGEIFRSYAKKHSELGKQIDSYISQGNLEGLVTGQTSYYCNTIELWITTPYASSLSFSKLSWLSTLYANVYVDEYVNPDTITGELVNRMHQVLDSGVEYTYNW